MPSPTIDFHRIRPHHGSQHSGFEELVCQLAALDTPEAIPFHRKGIGADAGLECYREEADGSETGWQAKYFFRFGSSEASQLTQSFAHAVERHPNLKRFIVALPFNLSEGRVSNRTSEKDRWDAWVAARTAAILPRVVAIELWDESRLIERLTRVDPRHAGRRHYWFDLLHFTPEWFKARFEITREALGRRYSPQLNIELPVRRGLLAIARDPAFVEDLKTHADDVDEARNGATERIADLLKDTEASKSAERLDGELRAISAAIRTAAFDPAKPLPFDAWSDAIDRARKSLDDCARAIWDLRSRKTDERDALARAYHYVDQLYGAIGTASRAINSEAERLGNAHRLLLTGEAGAGKSHLLADAAQHHIGQGFPAVLVLGSAFIEGDPWRQVAEQLGLSQSTVDELLGALDAAGEAAGTRALVMVDAINERGGIALWANALPAFLATARRFPNVAVILSCRTTFLPFIVKEIDEEALPRLAHPGFAGRAAEAAKLYLDHRGIVRMAAPNLSPEFENPLFLRTCCDALDERGERELPRGLTGVSGIFDFYFTAVADAITSRMGLYPRLRIVERALEAVTSAMVEARSNYLPVEQVHALLEALHPAQNRTEQSLFFQLENEGVLTVEPVPDGAGISEQVRFTFERLSDHRIAQALLDDATGSGDPATAFSKSGALRPYVAGRDAYRFAGIAEAFQVQLPERFGIELLDLVDDDFAIYDLLPGFRASLLWRRQDAFSTRTLELIERFGDHLGTDLWLETLMAIATEPLNAFNADYLDEWLRPLSLPERDETWSIRAAYVALDDGNAIDTLVQWVLANGMAPMEDERARLAAVALAWLTTLNHRVVRDMATKALAVLLVNRRRLGAYLIERFGRLNDPYVVDRVLAAVYGSATRSFGTEGLAELADAAFAAVFAADPIPPHALIRDHARGIIELAHHRGALPAGVALDRARPPYPAGEPLETIGDAVLETFVQDYGKSRLRDAIMGSAFEDGDFARYKIDSLADRFLELPRSEIESSYEQRYNAWVKGTIAGHAEREAALQELVQRSGRLHAMPHDFSRWLDEDADIPVPGDGKPTRADVQAERDAASEALLALLGDEERRTFRLYAEGWIERGMWDRTAHPQLPHFSRNKARRWVAWRAHDLGWTAVRFAGLERHMPGSGRTDHEVERIGKKYQWIAYHELTGRLSDTLAVSGRYDHPPQPYRGPWQVETREMDPTILVTRTEARDSSRQPATWWSPHAPVWRADPPLARIAWMRDPERDIPDPKAQIEVTDPEGRRWLVLDKSVGRNHTIVEGGERLYLRMTYHKLQSLLVARPHADALVRHLIGSSRDRDHPPEMELPWRAYLGEYPWHASFERLRGDWELGRKSLTVFSTIAGLYVERSGHNYSIEDSFNLTLPGPRLVEGLDLRLAEGRSLAYCDTKGTILFKDPSANDPGPSATLIDRAAVAAFLEREELELVWLFEGQKSSHGGRAHGRGWGGQMDYWGIIRFDHGALSGDLHTKVRDASKDQLKEFLAHR